MQPSGDEQGPERWPVEERAPAGPPSYALWLVYLYLRPRRFFSFFIDNHVPVVTALCAWMMGVVSAHDRTEARAVNGRSTLPLVDSWPAYLTFVGVTGVLSAVLFFYLGAWWYWVRIRWSGAASADKRVARRVYLYASTVAALPAICALVVDAMKFPRPIDAMLAFGGWSEALPALFLLWSVVISYAGVRTVFGVKGWRPALWFLALPLTVYGAVVAVVLGVMLSGFYSPAPSTASPATHTRGAVSFDHPGNWSVDRADPDYDPGSFIPVIMPQDARLEVMVYRSGETPSSEAMLTRAEWEGFFDTVSLAGALSSWNGRSGEGAEYRVTNEGDQFIAQVLVVEVEPGVMLEFRAFFYEEDRDTLSPGFEQIARSIRVDSSQIPVEEAPTDAPVDRSGESG